MSILLTDDEVIAVAIQRGRSWPQPLPTIELDSEAMLAAGARGARSLLVRGLARTEGSALVIDDAIVSLVDRVIGASDQGIAYVADRSAPNFLAGSSICLYLTSETGDFAVLDMVSWSGVHDLRETDGADGVELFLAGIENVFNFGFRDDSSDRDPALLVSTTFGPRVAVVVEGRIAFGRFGDGEGTGVFNLEDSSEEWKVEFVSEALGLESTLVSAVARSEKE